MEIPYTLRGISWHSPLGKRCGKACSGCDSAEAFSALWPSMTFLFRHFSHALKVLKILLWADFHDPLKFLVQITWVIWRKADTFIESVVFLLPYRNGTELDGDQS